MANGNIFDYFVNKFSPQVEPQRKRFQLDPYQQKQQPQMFDRVERLLNPQPETALDERPRLVPPVQMEQGQVQQPTEFRQPLQMPVQTAEQPIDLSGVDAVNERPRLVPNINQPTVSPQQELQDRISLSRQKIVELSDKTNPNYQPVTNDDKGVLGRLKDIAREAIIGAGQAYNQTGSLESALGGGIAGGLGGGFRPQMDEERQRTQDIYDERVRLKDYQGQQEDAATMAYRNAQSEALNRKPEEEQKKRDFERQQEVTKAQERVKLEMQKFKQRKELMNQQADIKAGEAKITVDENGKVWKTFLKADSTGKMRDPEPIDSDGDGIQDTDPSKTYYDYVDPLTGKTVQATGGQILNYSGMVQRTNADNEMEARKYNATSVYNANKENVSNTIKYNEQVMSRISKITEVQGKQLANVAEVQALQGTLNSAAQKVNSIDPEKNADEYNKAIKEMNKASESLMKAVGKTQEGQMILQQMQGEGITAPPKVNPVSIQPVKIGNTEKPVPKSKDPLGIFQ